MPRPVRPLRTDPQDRPFIVIWEVTRACALACAHCRADAITRRNPGELTTTQGFALLHDLASYPAPRPMVVLTGGDPFERPDLIDLVQYGTALGLHVSLAPSVTPRLTLDVLRSMHDAGASTVSLSIDGSGPATHDGFRGIPGTFAATLAAAADVKEAGLRLQINTTVTAGNVTEMPAVLDLVEQLGASLWSVFILVPTGRGQQVAALDADGVEDVMWWLHEVGDRVPIKTTEAPQFRRVAMQRAAAADPATAWPRTELALELRRLTSPAHTRRGAATGPGGHGPGGPDSGAATGEPRRGRPPLNVNAGSGFAFIDHLGQVHPSGFLPVPVGSVLDRPFSAIYRTAPLLQALRDPDRLGGRCGVCEFRAHCGGSRSRAYAVSGDPLAEDPACPYQPEPQAAQHQMA